MENEKVLGLTAAGVVAAVAWQAGVPFEEGATWAGIVGVVVYLVVWEFMRRRAYRETRDAARAGLEARAKGGR